MAASLLVHERTMAERSAPAIHTSARCCASAKKIVPKNRRLPMIESIIPRTWGLVAAIPIPL